MEKKKRASTASKKVAAARAKRRPSARSAPLILAPGEVVRLPLREHNRFAGYDPRHLQGEEASGWPIEGIILSLREISSGQLVPLASGDPGRYVLEVLHSRSFDPSFASVQNAGRAAAPGQTSPIWAKVRALLSSLAAERKLVSLADGSLASSSLASLLDGWRIIKVRADEVEVPE